MAKHERRPTRRPHHTGDLQPPPLETDTPAPTWGEEGGGGDYRGGPVRGGRPEDARRKKGGR